MKLCAFLIVITMVKVIQEELDAAVRAKEDELGLRLRPCEIEFLEELLLQKVFPNIAQRFRESDWVSSRAIISPTNAEVDEVNEEVLRRLPGQETIFSSIDSTEDGSPEFAPEFLNTLSTSGMPPHLLKLKLGALVILMRNMDSKLGHCNGVKYVVVNILPHLLELRSTSGFNKGATLLLPRITTISDTPALPFVLRRKQFPVKLAYGLSANKVKKKNQFISNEIIFLRPRDRLWLEEASTLATTGLATDKPMWHSAGLETPPV